MKSAVVYFPYPPFPVQSGGQWRCASIVLALVDCGYEVTVVSPGGIPEGAQEQAALHGVRKLIAAPSPPKWKRALWKASKMLGLKAKASAPKDDSGLRKVLRDLGATHREFDLVMVNYADNVWVLELLRGKQKLLDTLDLVTVSSRLDSFARNLLRTQGRNVVGFDPKFTQLDVFEGQSLVPTEEETTNCQKFDSVIMIAEKERDALSARAGNLKLVMIPPSGKVVARTGDFSGPPLFASGPNIFNLQGLMTFQERVLPIILKNDQAFRLNVTGKFVLDLKLHQNIIYKGLVPNINDCYQQSGFAIIPTFGGTGQQLKVVEAMGAGLAVVGYAQRIDKGIIEDGVDGFIAHTHEEYAEKVMRLWRDVDLRRRMGLAAQEKIKAGYSQMKTNARLKNLVSQLGEINLETPS